MVAHEVLADATAVAPEEPENEQVVARSSRAAGAAVAVAASATTAIGSIEPNILRRVVKTMSDKRVGWKEIEAWDSHLHMANKPLHKKSSREAKHYPVHHQTQIRFTDHV